MADTIQIEITREQLLRAIKRLPEPDLHWLIEQTRLPVQSSEHEPTAEERRLQAWQEEYNYLLSLEDETPQPRSWKREDLYDR